MTNTKLFKNSALSIFKNARFIFKETPKPTPKQVEKAAEELGDIENTEYRLQGKFTEAVTKFKQHIEETGKKSDSLGLMELIRTYKDAGDILEPVVRQIKFFSQRYPEKKILLVDNTGTEIRNIEDATRRPKLTTLEWAKAIGVEKSADALWGKINEKAQVFLNLGTNTVERFKSDAKILEEQIDSAKNYEDLETSKEAFKKAEKNFAEYRKSAQELQSLFGEESPLGKNFGELISQINELQNDTLAKLDKKYKAGNEKILEKIFVKELKRATEEVEKAEVDSSDHGWNAATGKFNLNRREFQRDTLGKHFDNFALRVNNKVAVRASPKDVAKNKNFRKGEYYYVDAEGKMTSKRALLTKDTVVSKDVPSDVTAKILEKNSGKKNPAAANPGEAE